jgi:20S proteasome alpha/beta subunit
VSLVEDVEYLDILSFEDNHTGIYSISSDENPILTVIIGAKCSDGIVLIADRKYTDVMTGDGDFGEKIYGDAAHFLVEFTGKFSAFDIFRKYIFGDILIRKDYTFFNAISRSCNLVKKFNESIYPTGPKFEVLIALHRRKDSELHYIDVKGEDETVTHYKAIGSGKKTAEIFCKKLEHSNITMKEFTKHAFLAIMYMKEYCPGLGVGVESDGVPVIKYLSYNEEWDHPPPLQDILEFKKYTMEKLDQFKRSFDAILKE